MDLIIRDARILRDGELVNADIAVRGQTIAAIAPALAAEGPELKADDCLVVSGLIETHIHLDKTCILDRCRIEEGTVAEAVRETAAAKRGFTAEDVYARGRRTLERCIAQGTMRMRTHVELDPGIGMTGFEAVEQLARDYAWAIDVEICVFPQEGLTNYPGTEELLIEGLRRGARTIGAAPYFDTDPRMQIDRIFSIARDFDAEIDMHLDLAETTQGMQVEYVCRKTEEFGWGGRVAVGHVTQMSLLPPDRFGEIAKKLANAGVAVTILPSTDLHLMGRNHDHAVRRRAGRTAAAGRRDLFDLDQQCLESIHALWRSLVDPDGQSLRQCLPRLAAGRPRRLPRHDHRLRRAADAPRRLRHQCRRSGRSGVPGCRQPDGSDCHAGATALGHQAWAGVLHAAACAASSARQLKFDDFIFRDACGVYHRAALCADPLVSSSG